MKRLITAGLVVLVASAATASRADAPAPLRIGISGKVEMAGGGASERAWSNTESRRGAAPRSNATRVRICSAPLNGNFTRDGLPRKTQRPRSTCPSNSINRLN